MASWSHNIHHTQLNLQDSRKQSHASGVMQVPPRIFALKISGVFKVLPLDPPTI